MQRKDKTVAGADGGPVPENVEQRIVILRGLRVMLDADLAELYGVETKALLQAVRRNPARFPDDFAFQLDGEETESLRSQTVTSNSGRHAGRGGRRYRPWAFTEQGVAMLSSVLRSERAIDANIAIMRAFVRLRQVLATQAHLARRLADLERRHDAKFREVFAAIRALMEEPRSRSGRRIGITAPEEGA